MTTITEITFPSNRRLEKIALLNDSPALSIFTAEEHIIESEDDFGSSEETIHPVWLAISPQSDNKTLQIWKDWANNVNDYFSAGCKEVAIIDNCLAAVLSLSNAKLINQFPDSRGEAFVSALCDMAIQLDNAGFTYKYWNWSNIVQVGDCWKLLPSPFMERTSEPNPRLVLSRLGKWLLEIKTPFLQTQPARSIVEMIASGQTPDEFFEEIVYEEFWKPQEQSKKPLQLDLTQNNSSISLEWESENEEILLLQTNGKKKAYSGQFIWHDNLDQFGTPLSDVSGINPAIDPCAGTAHWNRPQDHSKYQTLTITPAVRRDNWYEWGVPVVVGGPEEANLLGAYFDKESKEIVITPRWSDDLNISKIYIVIRNDRFANSVKDVQPGFPPIIVERRIINHPVRRRVRFSFKLYIVLFNAVTNKNKEYLSPGLTELCRKTVTGGKQ